MPKCSALTLDWFTEDNLPFTPRKVTVANQLAIKTLTKLKNILYPLIDNYKVKYLLISKACRLMSKAPLVKASFPVNRHLNSSGVEGPQSKR